MLFFLKIKHHNLNGADDIVFFTDQFKNSMFNSSIFIWEVLRPQHFYNIFTTNHKWLVVIGSNLNLTTRLLFSTIITTSNNLLLKICCENIVHILFLFSFSHSWKSIQGQICVRLCAVVLLWYVRLAQHNIKPWEKDNEIIGFRLHFESFLCTETTWVETEEWLWSP